MCIFRKRFTKRKTVTWLTDLRVILFSGGSIGGAPPPPWTPYTVYRRCSFTLYATSWDAKYAPNLTFSACDLHFSWKGASSPLPGTTPVRKGKLLPHTSPLISAPAPAAPLCCQGIMDPLAAFDLRQVDDRDFWHY